MNKVAMMDMVVLKLMTGGSGDVGGYGGDDSGDGEKGHCYAAVGT